MFSVDFPFEASQVERALAAAVNLRIARINIAEWFQAVLQPSQEIFLADFQRLVLRSSHLHERASGVCLAASVEAGSHGLRCQLARHILAYESHCYG